MRRIGLILLTGISLSAFANTPATPAPATATAAHTSDAAVEAAAADPYAGGFNLPTAVTEHNDALEQTHEVNDPYIQYNRSMTRFNVKMDKYVAKPVATFYDRVMPKPLNRMIHNAFNNLRNIPTVINDVLQGNFYQASSDGWRFAVNSTVGIAGLYDPAHDIGLMQNEEDFGLTLAKWGWSDSAYFVLPVFGPGTVRSMIGGAINIRYMTIYGYITPWYASLGLYAWDLLDERVQLLGFQDVYDSAAIDPYVFQRDAYLQHEAYLIKRNTELDNPNTIKQTLQYHDPYYLYN